MFGDPFSGKLVKWLEGTVRKALEGASDQTTLFTDKCIVCMEGPQFSTRAESLMYRQWGGDLINMSVLPEAKLAREAELRFLLLFNPFIIINTTFLYILQLRTHRYSNRLRLLETSLRIRHSCRSIQDSQIKCR